MKSIRITLTLLAIALVSKGTTRAQGDGKTERP
jgi:hypothetical protein